MKIELEFTEQEIDLLSHTHCPDFSAEQPHRFEAFGVKDGTLREDNLHDQAIQKFVSEHDGEASLSFVGKEFLVAKIYADYWTQKLGKKCHILWDTHEIEYAVWVPQSYKGLAA
jgi:hypothetical protein